MTMKKDGVSGQQMTTRTLLRLCATFEGVTGIALMAEPDVIVRELFGGGLSGDITIARAAGFCLFFLSLVCWPSEDDTAGQVIWAQLAYNLLTALYLGYLKLAGGIVSALLWPVCALYAVIALLLAGLAYERVSAAKTGRANQHRCWAQTNALLASCCGAQRRRSHDKPESLHS
jgi:hypothetical protein